MSTSTQYPVPKLFFHQTFFFLNLEKKMRARAGNKKKSCATLIAKKTRVAVDMGGVLLEFHYRNKPVTRDLNIFEWYSN